MLGRSSPEDKIQIAERTSTMTRVKMQEWASLYCRTPYLQATRHERGEMADIFLLELSAYLAEGGAVACALTFVLPVPHLWSCAARSPE